MATRWASALLGSAYNGHFESVCYHPLSLEQNDKPSSRDTLIVDEIENMRNATMKTALSTAVSILLSSLPALAQTQPYPNVPPLITAPKGTPSFFVTSVGLGKGGDLGGLEGADKHCQALATAAGIGAHTWRAYLSTQAADGKPAINARDRIGNGPWFSTKGSQIATNLADLHGDTIELAREGNLISKSSALTEKGEVLPGEGDKPNYHDVLTGSQTDGRAYPADGFDHTCRNWTSSRPDSSAQVGHSDRNSSVTSISWNSVHPSRGCTQENLISTGGNGLFYCFAAEPR